MQATKDLALLIHAARTAGPIAMGFTRAALDVQHKPGDAGPVTAADLAVNDHLHDVLRTARPDYGWLSEESPQTDTQTHAATFVIDPIDGTRSFIEGSRHWSHSLAVVRGGQTTAAVVFLPARDKLYAAALGHGATLNDKALRISTTTDADTATVLANKANMDARHWRSTPAFKREFRSSLAYRLALVAEGRFDAMLTLRPTWDWDIAAGALLVAEAGGTAHTSTGAALTFNTSTRQNTNLLAGPAPLTKALAAQLA